MEKDKGGRPQGTIDQGKRFKQLLTQFERAVARNLTPRDIETMAERINNKAREGDIEAIKFIYSFKAQAETEGKSKG